MAHTVQTFCCDEASEWDDAFDGIMYGFHHNGECENYDGAPLYRPGMGPEDPVRCEND